LLADEFFVKIRIGLDEPFDRLRVPRGYWACRSIGAEHFCLLNLPSRFRVAGAPLYRG